MKLQTHLIIAKIASEYAGLTFLEQSAFCIGSLLPDLSPMQFIHQHFYSKSNKYVMRKMKKISGKNSLMAWVTYGKMAHYLSDFCCSVHSGNGIGNIREHIIYEKELNYFAIEKYNMLKDECKNMEKYRNLTSILNDYHHSKKYDFYTDLYFAIQACISICQKALCVEYTPDIIQKINLAS